jgi:hypothetical protein
MLRVCWDMLIGEEQFTLAWPEIEPALQDLTTSTDDLARPRAHFRLARSLIILGPSDFVRGHSRLDCLGSDCSSARDHYLLRTKQFTVPRAVFAPSGSDFSSLTSDIEHTGRGLPSAPHHF